MGEFLIPKEIKLKNGQVLLLRKPIVDDVEDMVKMNRPLST